ncbi:2'-5' RNA ligase family protein [Neorhizobium sp. NPDC001467]|uniref:2'-5' RNA ligase family protein n=1 Tax=Neorhizobium sp. NPDC001467 TaxID=3390595 RepID=UPI003D02787C
MKTDQPLILTASISDDDLEPFDRLRREHFPPARNFLKAHVTMFHRLAGERLDEIVHALEEEAAESSAMTVRLSGIRHLGAGVAFAIDSAELEDMHARLKSRFRPFLGGQDMQKWRPHITVQNKVTRQQADDLYQSLSDGFTPTTIAVAGIDLWRYLGGPWQHERSTPFERPAR